MLVYLKTFIPMQSPEIPLSPSFQNAAARFSGGEKIRAWAIVRELLGAHPEYGSNLARKLAEAPGPEKGRLQTEEEWRAGLNRLFDPKKVRQIHGRIAILGLCRLDADLSRYLSDTGFLNALEKEMKEPFDSLLQTAGSSYESSAGYEQQSMPADESGSYSSYEQSSVAEEEEETPSEPAETPASEATPTPAGFIPRSAGYRSDMVDEEEKDHLSIEQEVANIAYVLTSKRVKPPLSLGLFGDWGSGKSFFMAKLKKQIEAVAGYYRAEEARTGVRSANWCSRVVHIDFNAWHFSDANLWASLVTRIYEALYRELKDEEKSDQEVREQLLKEVIQAEGMVSEAEAHLDRIRKRVLAAEESLREARINKEAQQNKLRGLISNLVALFQSEEDQKLRGKLDEAATALGYAEAARSFEALEELDSDLKSFSNRTSALWFNVIRSPWTLVALALLIIVLPFSVSWLLDHFAAQIGEIGKRVVEVSTFLFGIVAWLRTQIARGMGYVEQVEVAYSRAKKLREEELAQSEDVQKAHKSLVLAQSEEQAARGNLQSAQNELRQLESELQELRPERKLFRLIEDRSNSAAYSKHLGIISLIRTDFEKMSKLLARLAEEERDLKKEPPPIQRIILYIDDLDRCRPERVVEVLEAVHLLLAFPLFTVIVGVDPRWLRHSLTTHYADTLKQHGEPVLLNGRSTPSFYSTPQDYLEKIFQIPFALRPVEKQGFLNLVDYLLEPVPARASAPVAAPGSTGLPDTPEGEIVQPPPATEEPVNPQDTDETPTPSGAEDNQSEQKAFTPLDPQQLEFQPWEEADIKKLWPMFRTPRTVKRFINTYRLIRAGLRSEEETARYEGTADNPGQYQVALILLAMVTNFPDMTNLFVQRLVDRSDDETEEERKEAKWKWKDIIARLKNGQGLNNLDAKDKAPAAGEELTALAENPSWALLVNCLEDITCNGFDRPFSEATLEKWAFRVSRYSFGVQPPRLD